MMKTALVAITWLMLVLGAATAVPNRAPYSPPPPEAPKKPVIDLRGTTWDSTTKSEDRMIVFERDGSLTFNGTHNGSWRIEGESIVYFDLNNKYRFFRGIINGDVIEGESWNVVGTRWQTRLTRVSPKP